MSEDIRFTATVVGDEALKRRFLELGNGLRDRLKTTLSSIGAKLRDAIAANTPRGKTGDGAASWRARILETNDRISLTVSPGKFYLKFLEFGVVNHGTVNNKRALGKDQLRKTNVRRGLVQRVRELRAQGEYRITPRPFAGPIAEQMLPGAQAEIAATVSKVVAED